MGEFFTICCIILRAGHATTLTRCNVCDHVFRPNYDCICRGRRHYGLNVFLILLVTEAITYCRIVKLLKS